MLGVVVAEAEKDPSSISDQSSKRLFYVSCLAFLFQLSHPFVSAPCSSLLNLAHVRALAGLYTVLFRGPYVKTA